MEDIICTISIGRLTLDDDYTFLKDGKIIRLYDNSSWSQNHLETITSNQIIESKKQKILAACPREYLKIITQILYKRAN